METDPTSSGVPPPDELFDDRAYLYRKSGDLVASIARHHAGIDLDETTHERWRQLMGLMREVDTWADDTSATTDEVMAGLHDFSIFQQRYPALTEQALGHDIRQALLQKTQRILKLGEYASRATDIRRYAALRAGEARRSVELFAITATPGVISHPNFQTKFMPSVKALGEAATLWDSIVDGRDDKTQGKQSIRPGLRYYTYLAANTIAAGKPGSRALSNPKTFRHIFVKGVLRIANRIRNGVPSYSNARLFRPRKTARKSD